LVQRPGRSLDSYIHTDRQLDKYILDAVNVMLTSKISMKITCPMFVGH